MTETAEELARAGGLTFLEAVTMLPPGVQLAMLVMAAVTVVSVTALALTIIVGYRSMRAVLDELQRSSNSTVQVTEALRGIEGVLRELETTVQNNTVELARTGK